MDASSLPPELFACIVVFLPPTIALKLERVCKTWNTYLKDEQIWKEFHLPRDFQSTEDHKNLVLKHAFVLKNMKDKKCVVRSIACPYETPSGMILNRTSTCESDVLLTFVDNKQYSSSERNFFLGYMMFDVNTWNSKNFEFDEEHHDAQQAIITKNHIVAFETSIFFKDRVTASSVRKDKKLLQEGDAYEVNFTVFSRSDLKTFRKVTINGNNYFASHLRTNKVTDDEFRFFFVTANQDPTYETICFHNLSETIIVDLNDDSLKKFPSAGMRMTNQAILCGNFLARTIGRNGYEPQMEIIDTRTGSVVYSEPTNDKYMFWAIANDRLLRCCRTVDGNTRWILKDFEGKVIHEYTSNRWDSSSLKELESSSALIHGDIIAIFHGGHHQVLFYSAVTGTNFCVVEVDEYFVRDSNAFNVKLLPVGIGKFILSCGRDTRLLDFESRALSLKPKTVTLISTGGQVRKIPANFHGIMAKAATALGVPRHLLASVCIQKTDSERISMILQAKHTHDRSNMNELNSIGTKLLKKKTGPFVFSVNMLGYGMANTDEVTPATVRTSNNNTESDWKLESGYVHGDILLVREQLVQVSGSLYEWMPDGTVLSEEELEELTRDS